MLFHAIAMQRWLLIVPAAIAVLYGLHRSATAPLFERASIRQWYIFVIGGLLLGLVIRLQTYPTQCYHQRVPQRLRHLRRYLRLRGLHWPINCRLGFSLGVSRDVGKTRNNGRPADHAARLFNRLMGRRVTPCGSVEAPAS